MANLEGVTSVGDYERGLSTSASDPSVGHAQRFRSPRRTWFIEVLGQGVADEVNGYHVEFKEDWVVFYTSDDDHEQVVAYPAYRVLLVTDGAAE